MKEAVTREVAEREIEAWILKKKILPSVREARTENIKQLVDGIEAGVLTLDEEGKFTHILLFEFGDEQKFTQLTYKARLNDKMLATWMKGVKGDDAEGRMLGYVAALTSTNRSLLELMDSADKRIAMSIAIFFL